MKKDEWMLGIGEISVDLIEGAQNSFVVVSFLESYRSLQGVERLIEDSSLRSQCVTKLCYKTQVDGCIFVYPSKKNHFKWEFFNSDGSLALMCGNAARAICWWYFKRVKAVSPVYFEVNHLVCQEKDLRGFQSKNKSRSKNKSKSRSSKSEDLEKDPVHNQGVESQTQVIQGEIIKKDRPNGNQSYVKVVLGSVHRLATQSEDIIYDSGVPHNCCYQEDWNFSPQEAWTQLTQGDCKVEGIKTLRFPSDLDSQGANVTYLWAPKLEGSLVSAITFERGVEDWTLACGTGAMAAARFAQDYWDFKSPVNVVMPGGELSVNLEEDRTLLSGPVSIYKTLNVSV